ncbi:MAG: Lon protease family protein [Candidatus Thorarchaeota archaeon]|nr:MAG: Lon protease family protein [Candidatus Thorarchaeota archaeon]
MMSILDGLETTAQVNVPSDPFQRIIGQPHAVSLIQSAVNQRRHVLLCGVPGIGKSMLAKAAFTLLQPPQEEIRLRHNPQQPDRPQVIVVRLQDDDTDPESHDDLDTVYFTPDRLPFGIGVKMGYRCPQCGAISLPQHMKCSDCGGLKRYDWSGEDAYYGLFRALDAVPEPALNYVTDLREMNGKTYRITYQRVAEGQIAVTRQPTENQSILDEPSVGARYADRVLVSRTSSRFVRVSGTSSVELLGDVKHDPYGSAESLGRAAHMRVIPGAIHEAHEGILYIDEIAALGQYQNHLLTAMQDREFAISGHNPLSSGAAVRVDGVPCDFILFASCNVENLPSILPPLRSRIRGYGYEIMLSSWMEKNEDNVGGIVQFIAQTVDEDGRIPHLTVEAVEEVLSLAESMAQQFDGKRDALTLRLRELGGFVRIAGDIAVQEGAEVVLPDHVKRAEVLGRGIDMGMEMHPRYELSESSISKDYYF